MARRKRIFEREYHRRRRIRRTLDQHVQPLFGLGDSPELRESEPRAKLIRLSPGFETSDEACTWARAQTGWDYYTVHGRSHLTGWRTLRSISGRLVLDPGLPVPERHHARLFRLNFIFREQTVTWEMEVNNQRWRWLEMSRRLKRGSFQGRTKSHRRKYHKLRRAAGQRAAFLALRGETDLADDVALNIGHLGVAWDMS